MSRRCARGTPWLEMPHPRRSHGRGGTEMLYFLVYHVPAACRSYSECVSLHHRAHGAGQPLRAVSGTGGRALDDAAAAPIADRTVHSRRRAEQPSGQSRHADDGRHSDRGGHADPDAVLGRPVESQCAAGDVRHAGLRRHRFRRRLQQSCAAAQSRAHRPVQTLSADHCELVRGSGIAVDDAGRRLLDATDRAVLQELPSRSGLSLACCAGPTCGRLRSCRF